MYIKCMFSKYVFPVFIFAVMIKRYFELELHTSSDDELGPILNSRS